VTSTRATNMRAILLDHADVSNLHGGDPETLRNVGTRFNNAGDQPRIQWCLEHGNVVLSGGCPARKYMIAQPCRVVSAIVVPLEGDA
jgi:hypothetical protein